MAIRIAIAACLLVFVDSLPRFSRLVGGLKEKSDKFPYLVSLQQTRNDLDSVFVHFCGGSIINEYWILTAGHCAKRIEKSNKKWSYYVKAGEYDLYENEISEQESLVDKFFVHEKYRENDKSLSFDIALIKLKTPLTFNDRVKPITLPAKDNDPSGIAKFSGWGSINNDPKNPKLPRKFRSMEIPILHRKMCNLDIRLIQLFLSENENWEGQVDENNICTGEFFGGVSICHGDSGGPLVISKTDDDSLELIGIASWGLVPCGKYGISVYVRVSSFVGWINDIIRNN